jgi:hypothetical protein
MYVIDLIYHVALIYCLYCCVLRLHVIVLTDVRYVGLAHFLVLLRDTYVTLVIVVRDFSFDLALLL